MMRHVAWFNEASVRPRPEGGLTSDVGLVCRRCLIPARTLEDMGVPCSVFGNLVDADPTQVSHHLKKMHADIVVIGKFTQSSLFPLALAAKHQSCFVVVDIDHQDLEHLDVRALGKIVDLWVTNDQDVADIVSKRTGHATVVIPDCIPAQDIPAEEGKTQQTDAATEAIAALWLSEFKKLKLKPPPCANTNEPQSMH